LVRVLLVLSVEGDCGCRVIGSADAPASGADHSRPHAC
jgi:hypothetical protein